MIRIKDEILLILSKFNSNRKIFIISVPIFIGVCLEIQSQFIKNNYLDNKLILKNKKLNSICLNFKKSDKIESIYNLQMNFNILKNPGANYLLSSVMVNNNNNNLKLLKRFSHLDSHYNIFLC